MRYILDEEQLLEENEYFIEYLITFDLETEAENAKLAYEKYKNIQAQLRILMPESEINKLSMWFKLDRHWEPTLKKAKKLRFRRLILLKGGMCKICGTDEKLQLHHLTNVNYKKKSNGSRHILDNEDNLEVVCLECHNQIHHGKLNEIFPKLSYYESLSVYVK